jgi:hypothetical protein
MSRAGIGSATEAAYCQRFAGGEKTGAHCGEGPSLYQPWAWTVEPGVGNRLSVHLRTISASGLPMQISNKIDDLNTGRE